jgi:hypothetical protein
MNGREKTPKAVARCGGMLAYVYRTTGELHSRVGVKGLE